jgi:hypothetical protein
MKRIVVLALMLISPPVFGQTPVDVDALVLQLGDSSFQRREEAARQLAKLGREAIPALERGLEHRDAEVRHQVVRLLALANRSERELLLAAFLEGHEPGAPEFPGWGVVRQAYGQGCETRRLFVGMVRAEPELMQSLDSAQPANCRLVERAIHRLGVINDESEESDRLLALMVLAAQGKLAPRTAFLVGSGVKNCLSDQPHRAQRSPLVLRITEEFLRSHVQIEQLRQTTDIAIQLNMQNVLEELVKPAVREIVKAKVLRFPHRGECIYLAEHLPAASLAFFEWFQVWTVANKLKMEDEVLQRLKARVPHLMREVVEFGRPQVAVCLDILAEAGDAEDVLRMALNFLADPSVGVWARLWAINFVCRSERRDLIPHLESLLSDTTSFGAPSRVIVLPSQLRDIALAAIVHLHGRSTKEFRFVSTFGIQDAEIGVEAPAWYFHFESDEDRTAAFRHWNRCGEDRKDTELANAAALKADPEGAVLLRSLGSDSYRERQAAEAKFRQLGDRAKPLLKAGAQDKDPEVAARCRALLAGP